jgi:transcriptional regulator with XRE-family HTH domain
MGLTDKLDKFMKEQGMNKRQLAKGADVPYTTIDSFYRIGSDNIKLSTLKKLASYMKCSIDYLADDDVESDGEDEAAKWQAAYISVVQKSPEMQKIIAGLTEASKEELEKSAQIIELVRGKTVKKEE